MDHAIHASECTVYPNSGDPFVTANCRITQFDTSQRAECAMLDEKSISDDSILNIRDTLSIYARSIQQGLLRHVEANWR